MLGTGQCCLQGDGILRRGRLVVGQLCLRLRDRGGQVGLVERQRLVRVGDRRLRRHHLLLCLGRGDVETLLHQRGRALLQLGKFRLRRRELRVRRIERGLRRRRVDAREYRTGRDLLTGLDVDFGDLAARC